MILKRISQSLSGAERSRRADFSDNAALRLHSLRSLRSGAVVVFLFWIFLLTGCTSQTPPVPPTTEPTSFILVTDVPSTALSPTPFRPVMGAETPSPIATTLPTFTPTDPPPIVLPPNTTRPQYTLFAKLDYAAHTLKVNESILYTNQTGISLDSLVLVVETNRWANCFQLEHLAVNRFMTTPTLKGARMEIPLSAKLMPNESVTIEIVYQLNLPRKQQDQVFGYLGDYQTNIVEWYPFVAPYTHQNGWIQHNPSGVGEHLVYESANFDITFSILDNKNLVVAASAEGHKEGDAMRYHLKGARSFAFSVGSILRSQTVASGKASVTSFFYPDYDEAGEAIMEAASEAIDIYSERFAPYPHETLSVVQTDLPDGMEYDGLIFMGSKFYGEYDGTMKNNLISIGVHEVSHQWWFGLVGSDQALEPWLDEALSLYSERIYYETVYPYPVAWWWRWRVDWFSPAGWVDTSIYDGYAFRGYTDAVYLRGAHFLEALRYRIGEKAFNAFLKDYTTSNSYKIADRRDFFDILDRHTDTDYSDIVDSYFLK